MAACPGCGNENREGARFCDACGTDLTEEQAPSASPAVEAAPDGAPSEVAGGRYRIRRFLGAGGRKRVYLAEDAELGREVALALFDNEGVGAAIQARAAREAQAMRKLGDNPHVVRVYDTGDEDGDPFIVSEYMAGGDVEGLLGDAAERRLDVQRAVAIAADVCRALEHAHARNIVHRDLKPANVWLDEDGSARLGDFGLAITEGRSRLSGGALVGTVAYLPPEQAVGEAAGPQSDLYSLGALLYEMLTGQPPFQGSDAVAIISQHLHSDPVPPSRLNPAVPEALDRVVLALLAKRREDRPEAAAEVREALLAALAEAPAAEPGADEHLENPLDSLAGGIYVGRERETVAMREAVDGALGGRGRLLLLTGEPGIGKTRSAEELSTYARVQGARVYWGRCREEEGAPAYWPWVQAVRAYVRDADPVALAWQLGGGAAEVAKLVPEVAERLDVEPATDLDSEEARFRLFDAVSSFLVAASRDRPLVIVLDDLHWADEPSLLLLKFAAREIGSSGLLLVGTYRDVELGRHHPLAQVLGELQGGESGGTIALRGIETADVERYVEMTAGIPPPPGLAAAVRAQTEGNPFFVGEVVRLLASEGRLAGAEPGSWELAIPQGVREVVGRRLDRLTPETNQALRVAAAIGREFDGELVLRVAGLEPGELLAASKEAIAERLVDEVGPMRFCFSHALVRETLYSELSSAQRSQLHLRIAETLEELSATDDSALGALAHHYLAAAPRGDAAKAVGYARRAAAQAMERLAYEDAADLDSRALELVDLEQAPDEELRTDLRLELGLAQTRAGRHELARSTLLEAAKIARARADTDRLARAVLGLSEVSIAGRVDEGMIRLAEEALERVGPEENGRRAALLSVLGQELYWVDAQGRAAPVVSEAIELARKLGDDRVLASALHRWIFLPFGPDSTAERLRIADEMRSLAEKLGDTETLLLSHAYRVREFLELGDVAALDRELIAYERCAEELRMPHHLWHVPAMRAMRALIDGKLADAERLAEDARAMGERAEQQLAGQFYAIQLLQLRRHQGRTDELIGSIRQMVADFPAIPAWRAVLATLLATSGAEEEARLELKRLAANDFAAIHRDLQWLPAFALLGEAAAMTGDTEHAEKVYAELLPYDGKVIVPGRAAACAGPVGRVIGMLARTLGLLDDSERHLERAIDTSTGMGDRPYRAATRVELAETLLQRDRGDDRERALELLSHALGSARDMGTRGIADRALALRLEAQGLAGVDVTTSIDDVVSAVESERPDLRAHAAPDGTVAILFSDIEDSTILTERLGDERWLEVLRDHNALFREQIDRHGGYEVKSQGDGFMLAFPDSRQALECAIAVQRALAARGEHEDREPLRVRIGLHAGEVIAEEGDFFGKNVILAARIAAQAGGGEILVSEQMRESADGEEELCFDEGRELELKGLAGTHRVFRADWSPAAAAA